MKWLEKVRQLLPGEKLDARAQPLEQLPPSAGQEDEDVRQLAERGYQLKDAGQFEAALAVFSNAHARYPMSSVALNGLGLTYKDLKRPDEALLQFKQALRIDPNHIGSLCNAAAVLIELGDPEQAIENCTKALQIKPGFEAALTVLAQSLNAVGRHAEALAICDQLVTTSPGHIRLLRNRALTLQQLGRFDAALDDFRKIVELAPDDPVTRMSLALNALLCGDFTTGWRLHESRWHSAGLVRHPLASRIKKPSWDGKASIEQKTVLLYAEQGYGDTIQFSRYCKMVKARGARVLLGVPAAMRPLFKNLVGVDELLPDHAHLPVFDEHAPLMSLPLAFETRLDSIPEVGEALAAPAHKVSAWRARLGASQRMRVAVSWKGNPDHLDDEKRSIGLELFCRLFQLPVDFFAIQFGITDAERLILHNFFNLRDVSPEIADFEDSAALIECCDLVISVDSAPAHLAGAMGKPCWLLIAQPPDWRWLLERADSPWYPSLRLYRQPKPGDWQSALELLRDDLMRLTGSPAGK